MTDRLNRFLQNNIFVILVFVLASLLLNAFSFSRDFVSDDYCILKFLIVDGHYLMPGFFRPVGDLTLKITGWLFGLQPFYFFITNTVLHGINAALLFILCRKLFPGGGSNSLVFASMSAVIFLCYHSNSEAVLWTIGRGISLAVFFSLVAMVAIVSNLKNVWKYILVCSCYFIALSCYESVLLLPGILFLVARINQRNIQLGIWSICMFFTVALNFLVRFVFAGSLWGGYSGKIFSKDLLAYLIDFAKISARLFVPPFSDPAIFVKAGIVILILLILVYYLSRGEMKTDPAVSRLTWMAFGGIFLSISIAMFFGVSTRTSEGDRLLYFPSVFYSMLMSVLFLLFINSKKTVAALFIVLVFFQFSFNIIHQQNWLRASQYAEKFLKEVSLKTQRPLYIVNVPSDYKGAYIFRNCLLEALEKHGINSSGIIIVDRLEYSAFYNDSVIVAQNNNNHISIPPRTYVKIADDSSALIFVGRGEGIPVTHPFNSIVYWNTEMLINLK